MIGAIKRRWKSKKAKVLHKGSDLSTSTDSCPTSRGFVNGCDEYEKILKPPSPRQIQIHPALEKSAAEVKQQQQQKHFRKKCSTLPPASEGSTAGHPFIRVNSGRIELVNKESSPLLSLSPCKTGATGGGGHIVLNGNDMTTVEKLRRLGGRLRNDTRRSSWCGSAFRDGTRKSSAGTPALVLLDEHVGRRGPVAIPVSGQSFSSRLPSKFRNGRCEPPAQQTDEMGLNVYHLLEERLGALEGLTGTLQNWQTEEREEYERCMSELTTQVSRAVTLQQVMRTEVEKLQKRVVELETHNKAMTTMIVPTLMKLQTTVGGRESIPRGREGSSKTSATFREKGPERLTQSLERKENQKRSVKSPKQRKIDCRIPTINSGRVSRPNPPKQATEVERKKVEQVESTKSSTTTTTPPNSLREDGVHGEVSLSSPTSSSKSESSSSAPLPRTKSKGVRATSSSYSGIPRMSSPRPLLQGRNNNNPNGSPSKEGSSGIKNRASGSDTPKPNSQNSAQGGSRLPVRRNLSTSISSPLDKGNSSRTNERTTSSLTFLRQSPSKLNSTSMVKSVGNCSTATPAVAPKTAGKDEGYSTMSSEALAEQENAVKCLNQSSNFSMHKSSTFNTFRQSDNYSLSNEAGTRSPKRINFTSLPITPERKTVSGGPRSTVRIIRGITSYDIETDGGDTTEDPSTSTILWEDSDDSDILFLPLEVSSGASSSRSTLVPSSTSCISANGLPNSRTSSSTTTRTNESTFPIRRSRGEELVALLAAHRGGRGGEAELEEMEERALIEKWMRLEDVRNEVQWDDEWAWDWDGVARTHKLSRIALPAQEQEDDESEFWFSSKSPKRKTVENRSCSTMTTGTKTPIQIDSSTWTKSKKKEESVSAKKLGASLDGGLESNSFENQFEKVLDGLGNNETENEKGSLINAESCNGAPALEVDDATPPVIEFTPEFYHLVNYGSNLSVCDNEHEGKKGACASSKVGLRSAKWISGKMDDKVSQTDFSSSLENLSVSSELFTECRNCLELIKKLVGTGEEYCSFNLEGGTTLDRHRIHERDELKTDLGSPTAWVSVPKGLPTTDVDQMLGILSSSESEDILPQSK